MLHKRRKGSFSKSGVGSEQLNELLIRYVQDGRLNGATDCLIRGADIAYKNGLVLQTAVWTGRTNMVKLLLAYNPRVADVETCTTLAEQLGQERVRELLNDYLKQRLAD